MLLILKGKVSEYSPHSELVHLIASFTFCDIHETWFALSLLLPFFNLCNQLVSYFHSDGVFWNMSVKSGLFFFPHVFSELMHSAGKLILLTHSGMQ